MSSIDQPSTADSYSIGSLFVCGGAGLFLDPLGVVDCDAEIETIRAPLYGSIRSASDLIGSLFLGATEATIDGAASGLSPKSGSDLSPSTLVALGALGALAGAGIATALGERPATGAVYGGAAGLAWGAFGALRAVIG